MTDESGEEGPKYLIIEDSNLRKYLKEENYGFIARGVLVPSRGDGLIMKIEPMNKGCDIPLRHKLEELWAETEEKTTKRKD
jgi:hypothetical protein